MSRRACVHIVPASELTDLFAGRKRLKMPADALVLGVDMDGKRVGVMVDSNSYPSTDAGKVLPQEVGVLERLR